MREIPLTKGYVALVDDEDFTRVSQYKWCTSEYRRKDGSVLNVYAVRSRYPQKGNIGLHRFILGITDSKTQVDHEDHNGLNCQKYNLRPASVNQNQHNMRNSDFRKSKTSQFKGVYYASMGRRRWMARITHNSTMQYIGRFSDELQAAKAYDTRARELFGEFAFTNF